MHELETLCFELIIRSAQLDIVEVKLVANCLAGIADAGIIADLQLSWTPAVTNQSCTFPLSHGLYKKVLCDMISFRCADSSALVTLGFITK